MSKNSKTVLSRLVGLAGGPAAIGGMTVAAHFLKERRELEEKRVRVAARLESAKANVGATVTTRNHLYAEEVVDAPALARAVRACNEALGEHDGLQDLFSDIVARIAAIEGEIAAQQDQAERDRIAVEIGARAERILQAAFTVDEAATVFSSARHSMLSVLRDNADPIDYGMSAGSLLARGADHLSGARPLSESEKMFDLPESAMQAANKLATEMKAKAASVRSGSVSVTLAARIEPLPPSPVHREVPIALAAPAFFRDWLGQRVDLPLGGVVVPERIAQVAIAKNVGFIIDGLEGKSIINSLRDRPAAALARNDNGVFSAVSGGMAPAQEPVDLGMLPGPYTVILAEAAE